MLSRREHAAAEVEARLSEQGFAAPLVEELIAELREERLLDDERYALTLVQARAARGQGPRRIRQELSEAGIDSALATKALETAPDFHAIARALRHRRFGSPPPDDWKERARQSRFLQYRGFSNDHIASALDSSGDADFPLSADIDTDEP
jgi:regulatory protein